MYTKRSCITRMSMYKNALKRLKALGFVRVFSNNLADATGTSSAQVRKDFSLFSISGNKRGGYNVDELVDRLSELLGKNRVQKAVIVGLGNIGRALARYKGFEQENIKLMAAFDIDPGKFSGDSRIPVMPLDAMTDFVRENEIKIGIIAVPDVAAQQVYEKMVAAGIKGFLNFAPISLRGGDGIIINNINLEMELENLIYFVNAAERGIVEDQES